MADGSTDDDPESTCTYTVSVCAGNARLLSEFSLEAEAEQIKSIDMAESRVRETLRTSTFESVIAVVTEVTARGLTQVQISVKPMVATAGASDTK
ncbi:MAG TPA: hypothetical protein VE175_11455 [Woeseiaceae bacterium]|nr:hypothetical protein [Woeseiaceae bacterium]